MRSRIFQKSTVFLSIVSAILLLVACGPSATETTPTLESVPVLDSATADSAGVATAPPVADGEAYPPPPAPVEAVDPYPGSGEAALPPTAIPESYPPAPETFQEPRFRIDQPVSVSATEITGQSPPDTPLAIIDITYNGVVLGLGRSDANGRFSIPVTGMVEGNRIGLGIGELAADQTLEQMAEFYFPYRGEGFMNIPNLGIYFDTTLVTP